MAGTTPAARKGKRPGDDFGRGLVSTSGIFPRKGKGWGVTGEAAYPDLLNEWDRKGGWRPWRQGMTLAFNDLFRDSQQFLPVQVLGRSTWAPQEGFVYRPALTVAFSAAASPEGRWTVTVKPRGTDISPLAVSGAVQRDVRIEGAGLDVPLLEVDVGATWGAGALWSASSLVGELVEDSAPAADRVDPEDDEAVILMCVGVYPEDGLMLFDASQVWKRRKLENGRRVLERRQLEPSDPRPRFRPRQHLTQSASLSCNCPAFLGLEYAKLRSGGRLGGQELFPQRGPSQDGFRRQQRSDSEKLLTVDSDEARAVDPLEGVARRFTTLNWQRLPEESCKHVHAVRFALGVPIAEPDEYLSLASDYWDGMRSMASIEELQAPLASERFVEQLRRRMFDEEAFSGLSTTMSAGSIGDAHGIVPGRLVLDVRQVNKLAVPGNVSSLLRFNFQEAIVDPRTAEDSVQGDLWVGRGTEVVSRLYEAPQQVLDTPFVLQADTAVPVTG